jgi:hypothetical protein
MNKGHQIIAHRIDEQLMIILTNQFLHSIDNVAIGLSESFRNEFKIVVEFIYYFLSVCQNSPTPGMNAVSLELKSSCNPHFISVAMFLKLLFSIMQKLSFVEGYYLLLFVNISII